MDKQWGKRFREMIIAKGFNKYSAIAAELDVNESTVSRWAAGANISIEKAILLCEVMDVSMDWMFRNIDTPCRLEISSENKRQHAELTSLLHNRPHALDYLVHFLKSLDLGS